MCGIFGGYNIELSEVENAINLINRGNDGITITQLNDRITFAARRHLIKSSGFEKNLNGKSDQPYFSEDKKISLMLNGELYNFNDFKSPLMSQGVKFNTTGDTEVFLKLYENKGINFLKDKSIDSLYSLAIYDDVLKKIFITRDWPGRIPLYYLHDEIKNIFIFSSELKGFRAMKNISLKDPVELKPGNVLEYDTVSSKIKILFEYDLKPYISKNNQDIYSVGSELNNLLNQSSKNRTMGDVPICTMLSGGIDSVLTTFYVFKNIDFKKVSFKPTSYVFKVKGFDSIDVKTAIEAAKGFNEIDLDLKIIEAEPEKILEDLPKIVETFEMRDLKALSFYPLPIYWYLASEMHKDKFKVTIGGHGVDELLGAYTAWKELKANHNVQIQLKSRKAFINNIYNNMLKRASIIFMNRGPIEARFPFLNHLVCEFMLGIDPVWLTMNDRNSEIMLDLIEKTNNKENLKIIYNSIKIFLNDKKEYEMKFSIEEKYDIERLFWKLPLIVSSYYASKESFLTFKDVFRPKIRGQHGAGLTNLETEVIKKYKKYGDNDVDIFKSLSSEIFN
jgi:asparagine synthase (glutamine-hydrolysing)|tara:strand:- start:7416 stop:9098 length:1683 start_codon:yes stop_codon:yes gene_type:complete